MSESSTEPRPPYEIAQLFGERIFRLYDEWQNEYNKVFEDNDISCLKLSKTVKDLSFLASLPELHNLELCSFHPADLPLDSMKNLRRLQVNGKFLSAVPFSKLKHLSKLGVGWNRYAVGIGQLANLTSLTLVDSTQEAVVELINLQNLEILRLFRTKANDFGSIGQISGLRSLWIRMARRLADIAFLRDLKHLSELYIQDSSGFLDLSVLSSVTSLESLGLEDVGKVLSLSPLSSLPRIKRIAVFGGKGTFVKDNDYSVLLANPSVEAIDIVGRGGCTWRRNAE